MSSDAFPPDARHWVLVGLSVLALGGALRSGSRAGGGPREFGTYTYGTTPEEVIRVAFREAREERFPMSLVGKEAEFLKLAEGYRRTISGWRRVASNFDPHTEEANRHYAGWHYFTPSVGRVNVALDEDGFVELLRQIEAIGPNLPYYNDLMNLRTSMLELIGIEEI